MSKRIAGPKPSDLSYMDEHYTVLHYTTHVLYLLLGPDMISNALFAEHRSGGAVGLALEGSVIQRCLIPMTIRILMRRR